MPKDQAKMRPSSAFAWPKRRGREKPPPPWPVFLLRRDASGRQPERDVQLGVNASLLKESSMVARATIACPVPVDDWTKHDGSLVVPQPEDEDSNEFALTMVKSMNGLIGKPVAMFKSAAMS
jgi:hypothetical protein